MSFRLTFCTLIIGILTSSINGVPQYDRKYLSPVIDSTGASNWYTTNRETGTISDKSNKDSFTFIDSSEVHGVEALPVRRTNQHQRQQRVAFRDDDEENNENGGGSSSSSSSRTMSMMTDDVMPSMMNSGERSRALKTRSGNSESVIGVQRINGALKVVYPTRYPNHNYDVLTPDPSNRVRLPNDDDIDDDENVTTERRESDIVFPNEMEHGYQPLNTELVPKCKSDEILCTDVDNYPAHLIENIVKEDVHRFREFFGSDTLLQPNITSRLGAPTDAVLCESSEELVFPKSGLTSQDKWKFIVNTPNLTQGIRIEKCSRAKSRCNFANVFPNGYEPICEQKYIMRQLVSVTDRGKTTTDQFKIPSCCNCVLKIRPKLKTDDIPLSD